MATQLVRLRSAGFESRSPQSEVTGAVHQLSTEIDAIAEGLEEVARMDREGVAFAPVAEVGGAEEIRPPSGRDRARS
jgi:hypothetical protein